MSAAAIDCEPLRQLLTGILLAADFRQATFGGILRGKIASPWVRIVIRPIDLRGQKYLQFSCFDAKKDITKNFRGPEIEAKLAEILALGFAAVHVTTASEEMDIRTTKKGKVLVGRRKPIPAAPVPLQPHNRIKDVPLPEGQANRLLEAMGILTRTGQVRPTMRAKYTQINEFLKQLTHVLDDAGLGTLGRAVEILDCGCGSSYLTLAVHHYLNDVLRMPAHIMGVDVNEEVIRKSMERSERLGTEGLTFSCKPIDASLGKPDIVLALHACDTATDDAIAQAIGSEARLLLSVP
jgi:Methyltransferase domain